MPREVTHSRDWKQPKIETRFMPALHTPSTGARLCGKEAHFPAPVTPVFPLSHPGLDEVEPSPGATLPGRAELTDGKRRMPSGMRFEVGRPSLPLDLKVMLAQVKSKTGLLHPRWVLTCYLSNNRLTYYCLLRIVYPNLA